MTNEETRQMFNEMISQVTDPDQIAKLELFREYFTNEHFKAKLTEFVWNATNQDAPQS